MYSEWLKSGVAALCVVLGACSVKENRSACPCYLIVDPVEIPSSIGDGRYPVRVEVSGKSDFRWDAQVGAEDCGTTLTVPAPRPNVFVSAMTGEEGCFVPGEGIRIPEGEQCPPVYLFSKRVATDGETAYVAPVLQKQFCTLTVRIVPVNDVFLDSFHLQFEGSVNGYSLDAVPVEGNFRYASYPSAEGLCTVRLPRQRNASLMMEILEGDKQHRYFALGEYIEASGYDWTAFNLEDIHIEIDYASTGITVHVNGWDETIHVEILI